MRKIYTRPITDVIEAMGRHSLLQASQPSSKTQCDCYSAKMHWGCDGCEGNCGCSHWDSDLGETVPGC